MPLPLARAVSCWLALVLLSGCASASGSPVSPPSAEVPVLAAVEERPVVAALRILDVWDRRRAAAYATGRTAALRNLYAPGSRAGAEDVRILRGYADRGLVVEGLTIQVVRARLLTAEPGLLRLRVVDRMAGGVVVTAGPGRERTALPAGRETTRTVTLVDLGPRWVVRAVRRG